MELEQVAGLGVLGGFVWLLLSAFGLSIPKGGAGNSVLPDSNAKTGAGSTAPAATATRPLDEYEVDNIARYAVRLGGLNVDINDLKTTAFIESSYRPWVERPETGGRMSTGLMQTLISTARWLHDDMGYKAFERPTRETLKLPAVSMYYGAAYFDWLQKAYPGKSKEWYVRAYNGGPGHNYNAMTTGYWDKWRARRARYGGIA